MALDVAALLPREVFETTAGDFERFANRHLRVPVGVRDFGILAPHVLLNVLEAAVQGRLAADHNRLAARHPDFDAHVDVGTVPVMTVRHLHEHPAADHPRVEAGEGVDAFVDIGVEVRCVREATKRDLAGYQGHECSPAVCPLPMQGARQPDRWIDGGPTIARGPIGEGSAENFAGWSGIIREIP
jgi:hypothetical protein